MGESTNRQSSGRVLVVSATAGAGHNSAARAIIAQLRAGAPNLNVEFLDVLTLTPRLFRACYAGGYGLAVTRLAHLYGLGFWATNRPDTARRGIHERARLKWDGLFLKRFTDYLLDDPPDVIVHTHFLAPPFVGRLISDGRIEAKQLVAVTDNDAHRWWYAEQVTHWFAPATPCLERLSQWGIDIGKITLSGMPIHPKWIAPMDRAKVLADWNLPADKKIVLLSGGTEFTCGPVVKIARGIADVCPDAYVAVLAGRNKKLLAQLGSLPEAPERLKGLGFTDRLHELAEVASLMLTKPGGITTAECLAKGLPMVLLNPVPGQEMNNARYFEREGAAAIVRGAKATIQKTAELLSDCEALGSLSANARRLYRPGTQTIAEAVLRELGG